MAGKGLNLFHSIEKEAKRLGKSNKEAAQALGISQVYFSNCLNGKYEPSRRLLKMAEEKVKLWSAMKAVEL
jgi:predicted transcriptional regulator